MSSTDRGIRHEEFLGKKSFMEVLFHVQLILHLILSNFPDPTGVRIVVSLDVHPLELEQNPAMLSQSWQAGGHLCSTPHMRFL